MNYRKQILIDKQCVDILNEIDKNEFESESDFIRYLIKEYKYNNTKIYLEEIKKKLDDLETKIEKVYSQEKEYDFPF